MKETIRTLLRQAIEQAAKSDLPALEDSGSVIAEVSRSKDPRFGDYATNIALVLASALRRKPRSWLKPFAATFPQLLIC